MAKKLSAYQKLKNERNELGTDIIELITNPESARSKAIKIRYSTSAKIEAAIFANTIEPGTEFKGLVKQLS